ncbi:MAG TPA: YerC/YecD family TrpR-related protein [Bacteroidota bacterium]|nr:YerC/YecD family TrpR-related protein [Bacteroidota bacterium]
MRKPNPKDIEELYSAILTLESMAEARHFFRDLLTETEIGEFTERWKAARMLAAGIPYTEITKETGLSSTTVARVARWVKKGTGGYRLALKRIAKQPISSNGK